MFFSVLCFYAFVRVCLYLPCGHLLVVSDCEFFRFPIGILGQMWYLIVSISDLCTLSHFKSGALCAKLLAYFCCETIYLKCLINMTLLNTVSRFYTLCKNYSQYSIKKHLILA